MTSPDFFSRTMASSIQIYFTTFVTITVHGLAGLSMAFSGTFQSIYVTTYVTLLHPMV